MERHHNSKPLKIGLGTCVYSDHLGLQRLLDSAYPGLDRSIIVHSRYSHFSYVDPQSLARTKAVCSRYPNIQLIEIEKPITQIEARNKYLRASKDLDILVVMDTDDYFIPNVDWDMFRKQMEKAIELDPKAQLFNMYISRADNEGASGSRPRIFYKPSTIRYYKRHYWFMKQDGTLFKGDGDSKVAPIRGVFIRHDKLLRNDKREVIQLKYTHWQKHGEGK